MKKEITIEDIKKMAMSIQKIDEKPLPRGLGWFSRLMNMFGWHRKYEIIIIDKSKFGFQGYIIPPFPKL